MRKISKAIIAITAGFFIVSGSAYAGSKKVRIFAPTPNPVKASAKAVDKLQKPCAPQAERVVEKVYYLPYYTRSQRIKLFVGPRYPSSTYKQYSGPKYPF